MLRWLILAALVSACAPAGDAASRTTSYYLDGKCIYRRVAMRRRDYRIHHRNEKLLMAPIVVGKGFVGAIASAGRSRAHSSRTPSTSA